jgi:preprotein translocase subunit SecG
MQMIATLAMVLQILSAVGVIVLVLLQHGKGADMGAAFGSGTSGSLFGATGSANFLSRLTAGLATLFFVCTLALAFVATSRPAADGSVMERLGAPAGGAVPQPGGVAPAGGAAGPGSIPGGASPSGASSVPSAPAAPGSVTPAGDATQKSGPASGIPR